MSMVSPLHHLFHAETWPSSLQTWRWTDRPRQCPRCPSHHVGPWGPDHDPPGLKRDRWKQNAGTRPFKDLMGTRLDGSKRSVMPWLLAPLLWCLAWSSRRIARALGGHSRTSDRGGWGLRHAALAYAMERPWAGTGAADDLDHPAGHKGHAQPGGTKSVGRTPRGRRTQGEPGRGHDAQERPASIAGVRRQGGGGSHATRDWTVKPGPKAADLAIQAGRTLYTDAARRSRLSTGYEPDAVNHPQQESARGDGHAQRAECLFALLQPSVRVLRGLRTTHLPGYGGCLPCLRHLPPLTAFEQAELIVDAA